MNARNRRRLADLLQAVATQAVNAQDDCLDFFDLACCLDDIADDLKRAQALVDAEVNLQTILQCVEGD